MSLQKFVIFVAIAIAFVKITTSANSGNKVYIRGIRCNFSEKFIHKNMTCYAKSYSRTFSGANIHATNKKPMYDIHVSSIQNAKNVVI